MKRAKIIKLAHCCNSALSLSSCGGSKGGGENEAALGKYNALTYSFGDMTLMQLEIGWNLIQGQATISVDGDEFVCKWWALTLR